MRKKPLLQLKLVLFAIVLDLKEVVRRDDVQATRLDCHFFVAAMVVLLLLTDGRVKQKTLQELELRSSLVADDARDLVEELLFARQPTAQD